MNTEARIMRDVFIEEICNRMHKDRRIFFICADFGSPKLDRLKKLFRDRFINVGIAEQNLINIATGLALEGFIVYAYAIAPFLTMRAYEQIRNNLSLQSQLKELNVNLIGVGAGLSYDVSGPTHHCLEDISIMRTLPNITVFSPSDWVLCKHILDYTIKVKRPKYIRLDGKPLPQIYQNRAAIRLENGFSEIKKGKKLCLVSTGYMTHKAIKVAGLFSEGTVGIIDFYMLSSFNENMFLRALKKYKYVITLEEGFIGKAGLDSLVLNSININKINIGLRSMGFSDGYVFDIGGRDYLHKLHKLDEKKISENIKKALKVI